MENMYSEDMLRMLPCYHCIHCIQSTDMVGITFKKRKCELTGRWGNMNKGKYCNYFENRRKESSTEEINGHKVRKNQLEDFRTEKQWNNAGYKVKSGVKGLLMYASTYSASHAGKLYEYFFPDQVQKIAYVEDLN